MLMYYLLIKWCVVFISFAFEVAFAIGIIDQSISGVSSMNNQFKIIEMDGEGDELIGIHSNRFRKYLENGERKMSSLKMNMQRERDQVSSRYLRQKKIDKPDSVEEVEFFLYEDGSDPMLNAIPATDQIKIYQETNHNASNQSMMYDGMQTETIDKVTEDLRRLKPEKKIISKKIKINPKNGKILSDVDDDSDSGEANTLVYPYSAIGVFIYRDCQGVMRSCTASLMGSSRTIVTASHCVGKTSKGKACQLFWGSATFYAGYVPATWKTPAMWRGKAYLLTMSYWRDTQYYPDIAIGTLTNSIYGVGYLGAMRVFGDFFDPTLKGTSTCFERDPNLCRYSIHDVIFSSYELDSLNPEYDISNLNDNNAQNVQECKTTGMDYSCYFPRVITTCQGEWGSSGAPLILNSCGTRPKSNLCMRIIAIYKGEWCDNYVATALGYAWKAVMRHVFIPSPNSKAPTKTPTVLVTRSPTTLSPSCNCNQSSIGNGRCEASCYNSQCGYDGGDCDRYPFCLDNYCGIWTTLTDCETKPLIQRQCLCKMNSRGRCTGV